MPGPGLRRQRRLRRSLAQGLQRCCQLRLRAAAHLVEDLARVLTAPPRELVVLPCLSDPASQTVALTERLLRERERLDHEISSRQAMRDALDAVIATAPPR